MIVLEEFLQICPILCRCGGRGGILDAVFWRQCPCKAGATGGHGWLEAAGVGGGTTAGQGRGGQGQRATRQRQEDQSRGHGNTHTSSAA